MMGGPNFALTHEKQESWIREMPAIDMHVRGPTYEGEHAFLNAVQRYIDAGYSREGTLKQAIDGVLFVDRKTQEVILLTIFYYEDNFTEIFKLMRTVGVRPSEVVKHMLDNLDTAPKAMWVMIDEFLNENQAELFETLEVCVRWAEENYDDPIDGNLAGNLLSNYAMTGRFIILKDALDFLQQTATALLSDPDNDTKGMLKSIFDFYRSVMLHTPFSQTLEAEPVWRTQYDVIGWRDSGFDRPLSNYRLKTSRKYATKIDPRVKSTLSSRIDTFGEHASGLGRFTRTMFATDFRRNVSPISSQSRGVH